MKKKIFFFNEIIFLAKLKIFRTFLAKDCFFGPKVFKNIFFSYEKLKCSIGKTLPFPD